MGLSEGTKLLLLSLFCVSVSFKFDFYLASIKGLSTKFYKSEFIAFWISCLIGDWFLVARVVLALFLSSGKHLIIVNFRSDFYFLQSIEAWTISSSNNRVSGSTTSSFYFKATYFALIGEVYLLIYCLTSPSFVTGGFGRFLVFSHIGICLDAVKTLKLRWQKGQSFIAVFMLAWGVTRFTDFTERVEFISFFGGAGAG
jgi:hypothetical protein